MLTTFVPSTRPGNPAPRHHARSSIVVSGNPLLLPFLGSFLLYIALFLVLQSESFRLTSTHTLERWAGLRAISDALTPDALVTASWRSPLAFFNQVLLGLIILALLGLWLAALWLARPGVYTLSLRWVVLPILLFSVPLILLPRIFSGDLYLYMFYGRTIAEYGENPLLVAPRHFRDDSHLQWVNRYRNLPSAYGPVWLMFSAMLSGVAGEARFANLLTYKVALLGLHVLVTIVVWAVLRRTRPQRAVWGAIFYGWNPLVLLETVGNGHNDVMSACFAALAILASVHARWLLAVCLLTAAAMVKLPALLLLPPLVLAWVRVLPDARSRIRAGMSAAAVALVCGLALYAPLWAGAALFENALSNPAATGYANSTWRLLRSLVLRVTDTTSVATVTNQLDFIRYAAFAAPYLILLRRLGRRGDLVDTWAWVWFAYCLSLGWIWPWYFVLSIPIAAIRGGRAALLSIGLTAGGLIFWLGWPPPGLPAMTLLSRFGAVLLVGPAVLIAVWLFLGDFALRHRTYE